MQEHYFDLIYHVCYKFHRSEMLTNIKDGLWRKLVLGREQESPGFLQVFMYLEEQKDPTLT